MAKAVKPTTHIVTSAVMIIIVVGTFFYILYVHKSMDTQFAALEATIINNQKQSVRLYSNFNDKVDQKVIEQTEAFVKKQDQKLNTLTNQLIFTTDDLRDKMDDIKKDQRKLGDDIGDLEDEFSEIEPQPDVSEIVDYAMDKVVKVWVGDKEEDIQSGSGFIVSEDGYVVTNAHVILLCDFDQGECDESDDVAPLIDVVFEDGDTYKARIVGFDIDADTAVLKIDGRFDYLRWDSAERIPEGALVIALGHPDGLDFSVTTGVLSKLRYEDGIQMVQIDATIYFGSSGGPLLTDKGRVIGVNTLLGEAGLNFAVGSDTAQPLVDEIIMFDKIEPVPVA